MHAGTEVAHNRIDIVARTKYMAFYITIETSTKKAITERIRRNKWEYIITDVIRR